MKNSDATAWMEQYFEVHDGFCRPDWGSIARHIQESFDESQRNEAWDTVCEAWLGRIIEDLGDEYWLGESDNFLVVTSQSEEYTKGLVRFLEGALKEILTSLDGIASNPSHGKHVVIIFDTPDKYYSYISYFYPEEGEFAFSGGVYVDTGYVHFALPYRKISEAERTVAHELTHACLGHLPIPSWLNEGIAVTMDRHIVPNHPLVDDSEMMERHGKFWGEAEIQQFWSGDSFTRPDEGCELSYHLARLTVGALSHDYTRFKEYVLLAHQKDGGQAAAQEVLGGSLGDLMEQFLGPGNWEPNPEKWPEKDPSSIALHECRIHWA